VATAPDNPAGPGARREIGPFERAAITARFIGVAELAFGGVVISAANSPGAVRNQGEMLIHYAIAGVFIVPGLLYLILATWVARRRRWAVTLSYGLAMLGMTLMGMLFVLMWGGVGAWRIELPAGLFALAIATLMMYLRGALAVLQRSGAS
jgi:hypothetical protein